MQLHFFSPEFHYLVVVSERIRGEDSKEVAGAGEFLIILVELEKETERFFKQNCK